MKHIIVVPDGMADYPLEELNDRTPLEAARTTNMDFMAQNGFAGLVKTIPDKCAPGSDIGNLALLGYNPVKCFTGRAALEAASMGIYLKDDEVAFRCNLVTVNEHAMEDYSAGHIKTEEAVPLIDELNKEIGEEHVRFYPGKSYRHIAVFKIRNPKDFMSIKTVPPHDILNKDVRKFLPHGTHANMILKLMEKSKKILENHRINNVRVDLGENPANMIWLWGQGTRPDLPSFYETRGLKGAIISAVDLVNGIGKLAGLEVVSVPGVTGYYDTNYKGKAEYAIEALKKNDFVYIHIEGPDEAGHNGDYNAKIHCIEQIDREILGPILNHFGDAGDFRAAVMPDHPTPVSLRTHSREPVCFLMYGKGITKDGVKHFGETSTKEKGLKFKSGEAMMDFFLKK